MKGNELATVGGGEIESGGETSWVAMAEDVISQIRDANDAREAIDNMKVLRNRLDEQKKLKKFACEFCKLEAEMWLQIASADIDGSSLFTKAELNLVSWIREKTKYELAKIVAKCATGIRISNVRSAEVTKTNDRARTDEYKRISNVIISEGTEQGVTTLNTDRFFKEWRGPGKPDKIAIQSYRGRTKDELIKRGCVGLGDGSGTYISLSTGSQEQKADAVATRIRSILDDMEKLREICAESKLRVPRSAISSMHSKIDELALVGSDAA